MATIDDILGSGGADKTALPSLAPVTPPTPAKAEVQNPSTIKNPLFPQKTQPAEKKTLTYVDLYNELNPYTPPTQKEIEKEKKREKRAQVFSAIGDGISSLANLYFTTQYVPSMYDGKNTLSEKTRIRYDKLKQERKENALAYYNGLSRAMQADEQKANFERNWQRQLGLDAERQRQYEDERQYRRTRDKLADDRYADEKRYKQERDTIADQHWQSTFDENKQRADKAHNLAVMTQKNNKEVKEMQIRASAARGIRGKQLGFSDGNGNQVSIYENVWKGSMQQVYDAMLSDLSPQDEKEKRAFDRRMKRYDSPQKKEDFVKQNWSRSPKAAAIMLALSKIDPASMTSKLSDSDDDFEQYAETGSGDDDFSQYLQ